MIKPVQVTALTEYRINVLFEDNTEGIIDLASLVEKGIFKVLKDNSFFKKVYVTKSSIAWSEELEIDAITIYAEIKQKQPEELFQISTPYAAD